MNRVAVFPALFLLGASFAAAADEYTGPRPPKPDVPYLMHADKLIETEVTSANEQKKGKDEVNYVIPGAASPVRTPLAEPAFLFEADKLVPESLGLFRLETKNGNREVVLGKKRAQRPLHLMVTPLGGRLYKVEVNEGMGLEPGQYSLSPEGSNEVFGFAVE